ncbi:hypothetical protein [Methylocucumis oryzae]|nr:hypothetical protein [Methylocucumis oryzae]
MNHSFFLKLTDVVLIIDHSYNIVSCNRDVKDLFHLEMDCKFSEILSLLQQDWENENTKTAVLSNQYHVLMIQVSGYFIVIIRLPYSSPAHAHNNLQAESSRAFMQRRPLKKPRYRVNQLLKSRLSHGIHPDERRFDSGYEDNHNVASSANHYEKQSYLLENYLKQHHGVRSSMDVNS